jgi:hypothetical protein
MRSFFFLAAAMARSINGCATFTVPHAEVDDRRSCLGRLLPPSPPSMAQEESSSSYLGVR